MGLVIRSVHAGEEHDITYPDEDYRCEGRSPSVHQEHLVAAGQSRNDAIKGWASPPFCGAAKGGPNWLRGGTTRGRAKGNGAGV